jgi:hypothetical protein
MIIRCTRVAFRIPKATNTHSEYVLLIVFPLQNWLQEPAYVLHYALVNKSFHVSDKEHCHVIEINKYSFCLTVEASDHGYVLHTRRIHVTRYRI